MKSFLKILIIFFLINQSAIVTHSKTLQGYIEHSDKLEPLDTNIDYASILNGQNNSAKQYNWVKIPNSFRGFWLSKQYTVESAEYTPQVQDQSLKQGGVISQVVAVKLGQQIDKNGNVWQCERYPDSSLEGIDHQITKRYMFYYDYLKYFDISDNSLVILKRGHYVVFTFKDKKYYTDGRQCETIQKLRLVAPKVMILNESRKYFDKNGNYTQTIKLLTILNRGIEVPIDDIGQDNFNYRQSFNDYLKSHDLTSLIKDN